MLTLQGLTLEQVRVEIERTRTVGFKFRTPWEVHLPFFKLSVTKWEEICLDAFDKIQDCLEILVQRLCRETFSRFDEKSGLEAAVMYVNI